MKVAVLSCGRSDYSIYLPLLKKLEGDSFFSPKVIAFGSHPSEFYDRTVDLFYEDGFTVEHVVESLVHGDSEEAVSTAMGLTIIKFSNIWARDSYDLIFCMGDRYEMFSAVASSVPFNIPVAHLHGGETSLGAIDNIFRHSITHMSDYHFTSTEGHAERVCQMINTDNHVYNVGATALDNLRDIELYTIEELREEFGIDLSRPTALVTFHPETVSVEKNEEYVEELAAALSEMDEQVLITMPNADTKGNKIRNRLNTLIENNDHIYGYENLGVRGYFSCVKHCFFLLGNSSSGIIEAASLSKYVINVGDRQKGRERGDNVVDCPINKEDILATVDRVKGMGEYEGPNIYGQGNSSEKILEILKDEFQ